MKPYGAQRRPSTVGGAVVRLEVAQVVVVAVVAGGAIHHRVTRQDDLDLLAEILVTSEGLAGIWIDLDRLWTRDSRLA